MSEKKIQSDGKKTVNASVTVEAALVMPLILACITLLIVVNFYLHDLVILNGMVTEAIYGDSENMEQVVKEDMQKRLFCLQSVEISSSENPLTKSMSWEKEYFFPVKGLLTMAVRETSVKLSGKAQKQSWSMTQIIRYINQD